MATQNSIDSAFPIVNNTLGSWTPAAGTITSADTILSALQKISVGSGTITIGTPANGLSYSAGTLSLIAASSSVTGALTGTDWDTFNAKQPLITAGTTSQYYRGDKTFQTLDTTAVTEGTNLYYTNARGIGALLTGYVSGAGTVASTDTVLQAIQKLNGNITAAGGTVTSVSVTTANGVSGSVATATSTPAITLTLGAITPSTVNKVTITAPATAATLTVADNKTVTVNNSLTLAGTDSTTMTFPSTTATIARTDAAQTFTGAQTFNTAIVVGSGGTGLATTTAYAVLCGGTTSTSALQSVSGVGTAGQVLTSNGAGALPTWQTGGGAFSWGTTASAGTGTGLALSVGASAAASTTGFSYIVNNTQTQVATGMQITLGTSNLAHLGLGISLKSANTSGQGLYIDLGSTGLGTAIQIDALNGKYSSGTGSGAIKFGNSINGSTGSAIGIYFSSINSSSGTGYGIYYSLLHGGGSGTAYGIYMGNIGNGTGTTGYGIYMNSLNHTGTGNERYFSLNNNQSASLAAQTSACADILYSRTNTATTGTVADDYSVLYIKRTNVQNGAGGTFTSAGSCLKLENVATQTAGTLTDTTVVLQLAQGALISTNFKKVADFAGVVLWVSDGTDPNGTLTGTAGDVCFNCNGNAIKKCTGTTVWS